MMEEVTIAVSKRKGQVGKRVFSFSMECIRLDADVNEELPILYIHSESDKSHFMLEGEKFAFTSYEDGGLEIDFRMYRADIIKLINHLLKQSNWYIEKAYSLGYWQLKDKQQISLEDYKRYVLLFPEV